MSVLSFFPVGFLFGLPGGLLFSYSKRLFAVVLLTGIAALLIASMYYGVDGSATTGAQDIVVTLGSGLGAISGLLLGEEVFDQ